MKMELSDTFKMSIHICQSTQYCICEDHSHTVFTCSCGNVCSRGCILNVNYLSLFLYTDTSDKDAEQSLLESVTVSSVDRYSNDEYMSK